jgi:hypothetical protein
VRLNKNKLNKYKMNKEQLINRHARNLKSLVGTGLAQDECQDIIKYAVNEALTLYGVGNSFKNKIPEAAQEKLDFILGHSISRDFPKTEPTKEWAGAVLDFLEITGFLK